MTTAAWLEGLGISQAAVQQLNQLSLRELKGLMISDFERFGVRDMNEKQRLFRAVRSLQEPGSASAGASPALTPQPRGGR